MFNIFLWKEFEWISTRNLAGNIHGNIGVKLFKCFTLLLLDFESFWAFIRCNLLFLKVVSMETTWSTNLSLTNVSYCCFSTDPSDMMELIADGRQVAVLAKILYNMLLWSNRFPYSIYVWYKDLMFFTNMFWYKQICLWWHIPMTWFCNIMFFRKR